MDLYIVTSPSYLFTVLCLKMNENRGMPGDVIIVDNFANAQAYADRVREMNLFRNTVFLPRETKQRWEKVPKAPRINLSFTLQVLLPDIIRRRHLAIMQGRYRGYAFYRQAYARTFAPGLIRAFYWLHAYLYKKYRCELYFFDPGMATRTKYELTEPARYARERKLGCVIVEDHIAGRYFFELRGLHPSLPPYPKLQQIRPSAGNKALAAVIGACFDHPDGAPTMREYTYLFLQQSFDNHPLLAMMAPKQETIWAYLENKLPQIMIKPHPRTTLRYRPQRTVQPAKALEFFDVDCMFCADMDEKVLFSCYSTALLVPKHSFDQEPYVVFLYKLLDVDKIAAMTMAQWDEVIHRSLTACYRDPGKVFIPASYAELDACIDTIRRRKAETPTGAAQDA